MGAIRSVVIPAAGWGTRLLPASQSVPKELLPVYDRPAIEWIVEEALAAGIQRVIFISARGKSSILDHFDRHPLLESILKRNGHEAWAQHIAQRAERAEFIEIRQGEARGLGHAILCGAPCIHEPFFTVMLPDDLYLGQPPALRELIDLHHQEGTSVLGLQTVSPQESSFYGMIAGEEVHPGRWLLTDMIEKPQPEEAPSLQAITGRYVLPHTVFDLLETQGSGALGEIQLTDALRKLAKTSRFHGLIPQASRFDAGSPIGLLLASLAYGLNSDESSQLRGQVKALMESS